MKKKMTWSLVFLMTLILFAQTFKEALSINADSNASIVTNLKISNKSAVYVPNETLIIEGNWQLPDDTVEKSYKAGDFFSISIPKGLSLTGQEIKLGRYGVGKIVEDKIVFTFTDEIEQKTNRHGGFSLIYRVNEQSEKSYKNIELKSFDEKNNMIFNDTINVDSTERENSNDVQETFSKGAFGLDRQTDKGLRWYIRVNRDSSINGDRAKLTDRVGPNQILDVNSFVINVSNRGENNIGTKTYDNQIKFDDDLKGFSVDLEIKDGQWYNIEYETIYTGSYGDGGIIDLENSAFLKSSLGENIPMDYDNNTATGKFNLGGWGTGNGSARGMLSILKQDSETSKKLEGAVFKFTHKVFRSESFVLKTNEFGTAIKKDVVAGVYDVEEINVPNGYIGMDKKEVLITFDEDGKAQLIFENDSLPIDLSVKKTWLNEKGQEINSPMSVVLKLYADGGLVRQVVMLKGQTELSFKGLNKYNEKGIEIKYTLVEEPSKHYESTIEYNQELGTFNLLNTLIPLDVQGPIYPEEEEVVEETVEEIEPDPNTPVTPDVSVVPNDPIYPEEEEVVEETVEEIEPDPNTPVTPDVSVVPNDPIYPKEEEVVEETVEEIEPDPNTPVTPDVSVVPNDPIYPEEEEVVEETVEEIEIAPTVPEHADEVELLDAVSKNPKQEEGVLAANVSKNEKETKNLPQTGVSSNYWGIFSLLLGLGFIALSKKKNNI